MSASSKNSGFFQTELGLRILSAIVLLIVTIGISWFGGLPFLAMSFILSAVLFYEWQAIVRVTPFDGTEFILTAGFVGLLVSYLFGFLFYGVIGFLALGLLLEITSRGQEKADVRWIGLGGLYCAIPAIAFPVIRESGSFALLMFVFCVVWATDIAAYFSGRQFGGPKLMPAVSPKKTWSGAAGGLVGAILVGFIFQAIVPQFNDWNTLWAFAALLSVASQIGDLFESWVKRKFNVKDSSQLIPGHGGFLDRVDGLVAAAFPVALSLWFL
ncbi:MAG: phosphatidate cytidylyltransferase [Rhizobiaceae bacterium]